MSKELTDEQKLHLCNLASSGVPLKEAMKRVLGSTKKDEAPAEGENVKLTANDKKAALALEIEALGAEPPALTESVAKHQQALDEAKAAAAEGGEDGAEEML